MPTQPCATKVDECLPCNDWPVENLTAEVEDFPTWLSLWQLPHEPLLGFWAYGCFGWYFSELSQEHADSMAEAAAADCQDVPTETPVTPRYLLSAAVTVDCTDLGYSLAGTPVTLPAGFASCEVPPYVLNAPQTIQDDFESDIQAQLDATARSAALESLGTGGCTTQYAAPGCANPGVLRPRVQYADGSVEWLTSLAYNYHLRLWALPRTCDYFNGSFNLFTEFSAGRFCAFQNPANGNGLTNYFGRWQLFTREGVHPDGNTAPVVPINDPATQGPPPTFWCNSIKCSTTRVLVGTSNAEIHVDRSSLASTEEWTVAHDVTFFNCGAGIASCPPAGSPGNARYLPCVETRYSSTITLPQNCFAFAWYCTEDNLTREVTVPIPGGECMERAPEWADIAAYWGSGGPSSPTFVNGVVVAEYGAGANPSFSGGRHQVYRRTKMGTLTADPSGTYVCQTGSVRESCGNEQTRYIACPGAAIVTMEVPPP